MKTKKYDYYAVTIRRAEQILEMHSLKDFISYAQAGHIRQIMLANDFESGAPGFALASKGALYFCASRGFKTLEDFETAEENKFPDAATFYLALENNCATYAEYQTALADGITDAALFEKIKTGGYVEGFKIFDEQRKQNTALPPLETIANVKALFDFATEKGFTDFRHFMKVWQAGFTDPLEYQMAIEKGLDNSLDYEIFMKGGFSVIEEYKLAKPLGITTIDELFQYLNLNASTFAGSTFDELLLINIISKLDNDSKTEFNKLYDFFLKSEDEYKRPNDKGEFKLPKWFTKGLRTEKDVVDFLINSDQVKLFGTFHSANRVFETIHIKRRTVVVDGSNVAYNSNMADRKRLAYGAELKNILILVKKLKEEYNFEDIHVMSDFNLIHKVKDKEFLREIKTLCKYSETPSGTPADLFLINHVKRHHCLLVTNDTFKDWKLNDKWIEDNIDFYRLKFMLNGNIVVLPHMERFDKK
ncbi:MAG: hypothetical protein V4615_02405 [Bacteroidota bacterium]